jgi:hypothetical protein
MRRRHLQLAAFALIVVAAIGASFFANRAAIERERVAQIVQCERVQVLRDQTNFLSLADYRVYMAAYDRETKLIKEDPDSAATHRKAALIFYEVAHTLAVTGPTDCKAAVDRPRRYRAPAPEFIYKGGAGVEAVKKRSEELVRQARQNETLPPLLRESK